MNGLIVFLVVILVLAVVIGLVVMGAYNGLVRLRNLVQESWRQVDVELNRRYDLIPNLVETVKAFSTHERATLEGVVALRNQAASMAQQESGTPSEQRAEVEQQLSGAVRNLLVTVEAYPELKSDQNFLNLQRQLEETEDRIANGRRYYNANVRAYNTKVESVPTNIIAGMFHFEKATYFEVNDSEVRAAPQVNFGNGPTSSTPAAPQVGAGLGGGIQDPAPQEWPQQAPAQQQAPAPQQQQAPAPQQPPADQGYQAPQQPPADQGYQPPQTGQPPQQQ